MPFRANAGSESSFKAQVISLFMAIFIYMSKLSRKDNVLGKYLKAAYYKDGGLFTRARTKGNGFKLRVGLDYILRKNSLL